MSNTQTYSEWKAELISITAKETNKQEYEIKINDDAAKVWYEAGIAPYYCFREEYN